MPSIRATELRFSKSGERQGILVEPEALRAAEHELRLRESNTAPS
jgi:hypothetical protein